MPPDSNGDPLRIAALSDVHGNLPAFRAVLEAVKAEDFDRVWFLGDLVGHGAFPDECVEMAAENCHICLAGNHDLGVLGRIDIADFSTPPRRRAGRATRWARECSISSPACASSATARPSASGTRPRDPVWQYVLSIHRPASAST